MSFGITDTRAIGLRIAGSEVLQNSIKEISQ